MPKISLKNVTKRWGKFYGVDDLSLEIEDNSFITLLGPSGCGKTTILRMIAGLETPTRGKISIGDRVVFDADRGINIPPNQRRVGFLFQNYALWPNMTVYENIAFGLSNIKEDMATVDYEHRNSKRIIKALKRPNELVAALRDSRDKRGKMDLDRAHLVLIDLYDLSLPAAKTLFNLKVHEAEDYMAAAENRLKEYEAKIASIEKSYESKGQSLNDDSELLKDGQPVTSVRKLNKEEIDLAVRRVARTVKIGMFMDRYPSELSGGQQQRVAIARTLAPEPDVLFMDEPLSNLDAKLRLEMRYELQRLHVETGSTFVYVTHDQMEAMTLATKICLIENANLQQYDAPLDVYDRPANLFVADFVGNPSINFVEAQAQQENGQIVLNLLEGKKAIFKPTEEVDLAAWNQAREEKKERKLQAQAQEAKRRDYVERTNKVEKFVYDIQRVTDLSFGLEENEPVTDNDYVLGIRPEMIEISDDGRLEGIIYGVMPTGMESTIKIRIGDLLLTAVVFGSYIYEIGDKIKLNIKGDKVQLYDKKYGDYVALGSLDFDL